jgi:hypothetical protein
MEQGEPSLSPSIVSKILLFCPLLIFKQMIEETFVHIKGFIKVFMEENEEIEDLIQEYRDEYLQMGWTIFSTIFYTSILVT